MLQQLPCLKTLRVVEKFIMDIDHRSDDLFDSQLTRLLIERCSLSIEQVQLIVSRTPALRDLELQF